jgi:hypothetical protein
MFGDSSNRGFAIGRFMVLGPYQSYEKPFWRNGTDCNQRITGIEFWR